MKKKKKKKKKKKPRTMQASDLSFHRNFLKIMLMGLKLGASSKKTTSHEERKRVIKLSANIAMAVAGNGANWSRALITRHAKHGRDKAVMRSLLGRKSYESLTKPCSPSRFTGRRMMMKRRFRRTNSMLRRGAHASNGASAAVIAKSMVKKRTRILKRLVPGGECLDDFAVLEEAIDYVVSLQAQVDLMRLLTQVLAASNLSQNNKGGVP